MEDLQPPTTATETRPRSLAPRIAFWAVGAVAIVVVGLGLIVGLQPADPSDEQQGLIVENPDETSSTGVPTTALTEERSEESVNFIASVAATGQLESYELTLVQETTSFTMRAEVTQVGRNSFSSSELAGHTSAGLLVDGRQYELEGDRWYLKPSPARLLVSTSLPELTESLRELPAVELGRIGDLVSLELTCGTADRAWAGESVRPFCDDRVMVTATIDLETGLLVSLRGEGEIETFPGNYEDGFVEIQVTPTDGHEPIEAPVVYDTSRAECIGEKMEVLDYAEMAALLDNNTTIENQVLFSGCGFELFPPGNDFQSTD